MVNFPVDPLPFTPQGLTLKMGGLIGCHERWCTSQAMRFMLMRSMFSWWTPQQILDANDIQGFIQQVTDYVLHTFHIPIRSSCRHPFGIGLFELDATFCRDLLFTANTHNIDGIEVNFISHDHALNRRNWNYTRYGLIMLLGYPLDYRNLEHIDQAVSPFAKLVTWHNNMRSLGYVLVKCLYNDVQSVLRSLLVLRQGERNGTGWCWTVPVYVLNWDHLDVQHPNVDDIPPGGNPHPFPHPPAMDDIFQAEHLAEQALDDAQFFHNLQNQQAQQNQEGPPLDAWEAAAAQAQGPDVQG
jgi:hypothetical protein